MIKTVLKKTSNKGWGCYAAENIQKFEIVSVFLGTLIDENSYNSKYTRIKKYIARGDKGYSNPDKYCIEVEMDNIKGILDPTSIRGNLRRNLSHAWYANEPNPEQSLNCEITQNYETYTLVILAIQNIQKGDEILIYYGNQYERTYPICKLNYYEKTHTLYIHLGWIISFINHGRNKPEVLGTLTSVCNHCTIFGPKPVFEKKRNIYIQCLSHDDIKTPDQIIKILQLELKYCEDAHKRTLQELKNLKTKYSKLKKKYRISSTKLY